MLEKNKIAQKRERRLIDIFLESFKNGMGGER